MGCGENIPEQVVARQRANQGKRRGSGADNEWEQAALESGFHLVKRHPFQGSGEEFELDRERAPEWLADAIALYKGGASRSDVSRYLSEELAINASSDQVGEVLKTHGRLRLRRPGAEAPNEPWPVKNPNGIDSTREELLAKHVELWRADPELSDEDVQRKATIERASCTKQLASLYTSEEPWSRPAAINEMLAWLANHQSWNGNRPDGLVAEDMLVASWKRAGYKVKRAPAGNAGADFAVEIGRSREPTLAHYSCKSSVKKGQRSGGSISIQSLVQHGQKKLETPAHCRKALKAALEHLDDYERVAYVQGVDGHYPDTGKKAWAYHVNEIPKKDLHSRLKALKPADFQKALDERDASAARSSVIVKVRGDDGRVAFHLKITKNVIAITAIQPSYYRRALSLFLEPPADQDKELDRTETERQKRARGRKRRSPAQKRGP